jgi:hypothetical protein
MTTCTDCTCKSIPANLEELSPLFTKLKKARFTGSLELRFEDGQPASATLTHYLPFSEIGRALPTKDDKPEESGRGILEESEQ